MKTSGFDLIEKGKEYNVIWTSYTQFEDVMELHRYQKINHFPNSMHLGRKDLFWKGILRMKLKYLEHFNISPHTWILPA
jgi:hypothetical protein